MKYNPAIHHRQSIRLHNYDYSQTGAYFITICTKNREYLFGEIINGEASLNECGRIVRDEWQKTAIMRKNIEIDAFVIMPNHVHGIIIIDDPCGDRRGTMHRAPTTEKFGKPTSNTIPTIIRGFKSIVTNRINKMRMTKGTLKTPESVWQCNYYERIIRSDEDLSKIREYIYDNPAAWTEDEYFDTSSINS